MTQQLVFTAPRRALPPRHLADLDSAGRTAAVAELGLPAFRANQLAHQYYGRLIADPQQMTDLPAAVRSTVADALFPTLLTAVSEIECDAGETRKTLWRAGDHTKFESVLMRYPRRNTVCISSQAGCGMACRSARPARPGSPATCPPPRSSSRCGPPRWRCDTAAALDPPGTGCPTSCSWVWGAAGQLCPGGGRRPPDHRTAPNGFGISARSVTVSTVGLAPAIRKLADEGLG